MDIKIIVGKNIRGFRNKLGVSQEKFAELADINRSYVGDVERGKFNLSIATLYKIAKALKVEPGVLFVKDSYKEK